MSQRVIISLMEIGMLSINAKHILIDMDKTEFNCHNKLIM